MVVQSYSPYGGQEVKEREIRGARVPINPWRECPQLPNFLPLGSIS
jgi:hypothetical protein